MKLASQLHQGSLVVVTHCHRPIASDIPLMLAGGVTAKVYQVSIDVDVNSGLKASRDRKDGWLRLAVEGMENALDEIEANLGRCKLAKTVTDIQAAFEEGGVAILLGTEGAHWLEGSVKPLRLFHRLGLRELQLTWDTPNELVPDGHLSGFGLNVISECARLGIIVDVTHIPQQAFYEVMEVSERPVIVSHGTACGVTEDLEDEQIQALAATGGLLGVHFYTTYLGPSPGPEDVVRQIEYIAEIAGIDHVALGADFFPTEGAWRDLQVAQGTTELEWAIPDMSEMPRITECMVERGFSALDVQKVLGKNFLRVCEQVFV